jgi:hypothetical protein
MRVPFGVIIGSPRHLIISLAEGSAYALYPHLDVGLPAFYDKPELLCGSRTQGRDIGDCAYGVRHQEDGSNRLDLNGYMSVNAFEAELHCLGVKIIGATLPPCSSLAACHPKQQDFHRRARFAICDWSAALSC